MVDINRSETDILVFISSVMNDDLEYARRIAKDTIASLDFGRPWAFEFTPASSEDVDQAYLRKVSEADFVIWLVGNETTDPVTNEINQCLASEGRLLVFRLPTTKRDDRTASLLDQVGSVTKWQTLESVDELRDHIKLTFADEVVRALRDPIPRLRNKRLAELYSLSVSWCKATWQSLGVPEEIADELSRDIDVGATVDLPDHGVHSVQGIIGQGKSLACHRLFQKAVKRTLEDPSQPFPVVLDAKDLQGSLSGHIEKECLGYADPFTQGVLVIIDGVDERGLREARDLLQQVSAYADANQRARVLASMRPIPGLEGIGKNITIPCLDDDQMVNLINRISGFALDIHNTYHWPDSMRQAAKIPLFTVMIASRLRDNPDLVYASQFRLIEDLVEDALSKATENTEQLDQLLHTLATYAINSGSPVFLNEVDRSRAKQKLLIASRLVSESSGRADFTLPIFREWYAARALLEGTIVLDEFEQVSDRWLLPCTMAIHSGDANFVHSLMSLLVTTDPGLASQLLYEHDPRLRNTDENRNFFPASLASAESAGEAILNALKTWNDGLGNSYGVLGPTDQHGNTAPLRIKVKQRFISTWWYHGMEVKPRLVTDFESLSEMERTPGWSMFATGVAATELWPWLFTKKYLTNSLSSGSDFLRFTLTSDDALQELSWQLARSIEGNSSSGSSKIDIERVLKHVERWRSSNFTTLNADFVTFPDFEVKAVNEHLKTLLADNETHIANPWPQSDLDVVGGSLWESFSDDQFLSRTQAIFGAALRIYDEMVRGWFTKFAFRLGIHSLMPFRLEGVLDLPTNYGDRSNAPRLMWQPRILPEGDQSHAIFELGTTAYDASDVEQYFAEESEVFSKLRNQPAKEAPLFRQTSLFSREIQGPRPATTLACEWLSAELRDVRWEG